MRPNSFSFDKVLFSGWLLSQEVGKGSFLLMVLSFVAIVIVVLVLVAIIACNCSIVLRNHGTASMEPHCFAVSTIQPR